MEQLVLVAGGVAVLAVFVITVSVTVAVISFHPMMRTIHPCSSSFGPSFWMSALVRTKTPGLGCVASLLTDFPALYPLRMTHNLPLQLYAVLIILSPPPVTTHPSEKKYWSRASPTNAIPLPSLADAGSVDLTVVIPAYNETERLPSMLATTLAHLETSSIKNTRTYEVLIVDDGSSDGTAAMAIKLAYNYPNSEIRVAKLEKNLGKGGAVRHAMLHSRGERLLMVDADGASRFEDLELLWKALNGLAPDNGPALVVGSRAHLVKTDAVVKVSTF